ncbi:prepilin-type N-terminal cleavage/methylation domain-containing protein [Halomonas sp. DP8Y7-1]|uniref:PilW family protein n=1 Tax=unclassified Halomonas TaxID=2609666 RepID=UPI001C97D316|nr:MULTISPECIES: prepilin-type N-terminal cleavage/methylation domain-containing protein [unclassified Halomonas]MBY5930323.1 prepilin-type N-terminal cleavage/methylation domain-containing protein [Halomonas sp. DP8Y7-3]MBY5985961.1 prepilin-type N-terminal cleavage/methylation domain-containing protein [Halomonas sp. DP5Y7-2]MBY6027908.1 prepilin-type N-terminal cleavage/methylation domain-containing protein [Halomonas sp. DP8Y7-1]MED5294421.1 prepilin-type N-terminal cleavage/methylation dom
MSGLGRGHLAIRLGAQRGVSLVELMVAMLVGSLVILAAGNLFHEANVSANTVLRLADRQAVISYALDTVTAAVRRGAADVDSYVLRPSLDGEGCTLHDALSGEPLVDGLADSGHCDQDPVLESLGEGLYRITLSLPHSPVPLSLHVVNRQTAMASLEGSP